jgi:hypothetical protein
VKRLVLFTFCALLIAGLAFGQAGSIMIFSDFAFSDCNITDYVPALVTTYVVHMYTTGATASQWRIESPCNLMLYLGEVFTFPTVIGNTQTGISVAYGSCLVGPIYLSTINWFAQGITPPCCMMSVVEDPGAPSGLIEAVDCAQFKVFPTGGQAIINGQINECWCSVPVQETTWGRVKSMYR